MGAHLEYDEVGLLDAARQRLDEAGRGDDIVLSERDLRRRGDLAELPQRVMGDDRVRLAKEGLDRLLWPAADEGRGLIDVFGIGWVELRREAEGKDPLDDHLLGVAEALGDGLPVPRDDLQKRVALRPTGMQRERLDPLGVFAREP